MRNLLGPILSLMLTILCQPALADGSMLSFFPEDVAHETQNAQASFFNVSRLGKIFTPPHEQEVQRRLRAMQTDAKRLLVKPPRSLKGESDLACTAVAVFFEARGESNLGQRAVASVVLQRALTPDRWGDRPCDVVRPVQFSFMTSRYGYPSITKQDGWETSWPKAIDAAARILASGPMADLKGADHYHTRDVRPSWRLKMPRVATIGHHIFYADPQSEPVAGIY